MASAIRFFRRVAAALSVNFTQFFSLHTGFHWKSDNPRISIGSLIALNRITYVVNYNVNVMSGVSPFDNMSIQAVINF